MRHPVPAVRRDQNRTRSPACAETAADEPDQAVRMTALQVSSPHALHSCIGTRTFLHIFCKRYMQKHAKVRRTSCTNTPVRRTGCHPFASLQNNIAIQHLQ